MSSTATTSASLAAMTLEQADEHPERVLLPCLRRHLTRDVGLRQVDGEDGAQERRAIAILLAEWREEPVDVGVGRCAATLLDEPGEDRLPDGVWRALVHGAAAALDDANPPSPGLVQRGVH